MYSLIVFIRKPSKDRWHSWNILNDQKFLHPEWIDEIVNFFIESMFLFFEFIIEKLKKLNWQGSRPSSKGKRHWVSQKLEAPSNFEFVYTCIWMQILQLMKPITQILKALSLKSVLFEFKSSEIKNLRSLEET